jgi:pseudouridylate synthase
MGLNGGILIACPIPAEDEIPGDEMESVIERALSECAQKGISGKRVTPYLLDYVKILTEGRSLKANIRLVLNNAEIGGDIAVKL